MSDKNIEEFLRNSRPEVKDNPTFMLRTLQNIERVEGIKGEVDRQRRHGRAAVLAVLGIGMIAGLFIAAAMILFPKASAILIKTLRDALGAIPYSLKLFITTVAILAVSLGLAVPSGRQSRTF